LTTTISTKTKTGTKTSKTAVSVITIPPSPLLDQKIDEITAGLPASYGNNLCLLSNQQNIPVIIEYIQAMKTETNLSDHYRKDTIDALTRFSKYSNKSFKDISRNDVIAFLDSFRKTETADPLHRWIGTYNQYRMQIFRFFKWLCSPNLEQDKRPKPSIIENIPLLKRKEVSTYKPSDLWASQDDLLFLKYCHSKREKCYHAMSRDLSCRPHEILKLKIKDISFKTLGNSQYAEVVVNGKTGSRPIPLINSIPYLKDYLDHEHPQPGNPNSPLICGTGKGLGRHIKPIRVAHIYENYKKKIFPSLIVSPNVLPEDKQRIRELLKKPWNPYIRRHSALTEKSTILKEHVLRQHAGWTPGSQMHLKYLHYFGNESNESLLEAYGIVTPGQQIDQLKPKQCPNCSEPNKPDSKFCAKCRMVLTYDAYNKTLEDQRKKEDDVSVLKQQMYTIISTLESLDIDNKNKVANQLIQKGIYKSIDSPG
jgi:integrase/recombinase XerD